AVVDREVKLKNRRRGLSPSEMVESLLAMWATGGERTEDLDQFRQDKALALLLGHELPAAQTARDFLVHFHAEDLPLLQEGKAPAALPGGIDKTYLRGDSALYEHELMRWLDEQAIGYAISADMSAQLAECIAALPENHWKPDKPETDAIREWAEVNYLPSDGI